MPEIKVTVHTFLLNGTFVQQEPGHDASLQELLRETIGSLPNRIKADSIGVFEVRVMNDRIKVYIMSAIVDTVLLKAKIDDILFAGQFHFYNTRLKGRMAPIIFDEWQEEEDLGTNRMRKHLRETAGAAIVHFVAEADAAFNNRERIKYNMLAYACIKDLVATMPLRVTRS